MKSLHQCWRWYGPNDPVKLSDIQQAGATGLVHALHHIPVGEVWSVEEIRQRQQLIQSQSKILAWEVVESVNVHESIKLGLADRDHYIVQYQQTLRNLSACGITTACYNFMPALDWTRTALDYTLANGAKALRFDWVALAAFDLYILKRPNAMYTYSHQVRSLADEYFFQLSEREKEILQHSILAGLPGTTDVLSLEEFEAHLDRYKEMDAERLKENLRYFLQQVIPVAEACGIKMCIHPDDPPYPIFDLPRIVSTEEDLTFIVNAVDSPANGITFCTGSLGPNAANDLAGIVERLGYRIHFVHLRNIQRQEEDSFYEAEHLGGDVDMLGVMQALVRESIKRKKAGSSDYQLPFRPDHGHQMLDDLQKDIIFPGYSAIGRLKGLAELRGMGMAVEQYEWQKMTVDSEVAD
ncbi:mannonate dehydratase [Limibacter armeniacum]|uniref:mannonate dehydratase n=1 Tax=Limibacter armeniacum TaxID=466084 RepID=UPI002FE54535